MKKASKIATGRTKNSLAFPERSLTTPTFSISSSTSKATKKVPPSRRTFDVRPPKVGLTTPIRMINCDTVRFTVPKVTAQTVIQLVWL